MAAWFSQDRPLLILRPQCDVQAKQKKTVKVFKVSRFKEAKRKICVFVLFVFLLNFLYIEPDGYEITDCKQEKREITGGDGTFKKKKLMLVPMRQVLTVSSLPHNDCRTKDVLSLHCGRTHTGGPRLLAVFLLT